jgi:hypothetical protein
VRLIQIGLGIRDLRDRAQAPMVACEVQLLSRKWRVFGYADCPTLLWCRF